MAHQKAQDNGVWSKLIINSLGILCQVTSSRIFLWNVNLSCLSRLGAIGIFDVVAIFLTIFFSVCIISFKIFLAHGSRKTRCPPYSVSKHRSSAITTIFDIALMAALFTGAPFKPKDLTIWIVFAHDIFWQQCGSSIFPWFQKGHFFVCRFFFLKVGLFEFIIFLLWKGRIR